MTDFPQLQTVEQLLLQYAEISDSLSTNPSVAIRANERACDGRPNLKNMFDDMLLASHGQLAEFFLLGTVLSGGGRV